MEAQTQLLQIPPDFCQYSEGPCDQKFEGIENRSGLFLFGSQPTTIAATIEAAAGILNGDGGGGEWKTWRDLDVAGQIVFCEICKAIRGSECVYADVTTLNFNLMFEIGFCIGLSVPVKPIRDTSFQLDEDDFRTLGVLDSLGYLDFSNSNELAKAVSGSSSQGLDYRIPTRTYRETPIYALKGPVANEGWMRLQSLLKKSRTGYRTYDPEETPRVSLLSHHKQIRGSYGVVANLLSPDRKEATAHNALCALTCGIAMAEQRPLLMIQEGVGVVQPLDYRDVVQPYSHPDEIERLLGPLLGSVMDRLQTRVEHRDAVQVGLLEQIDLGDPAAENEIQGLGSYFVPTGEFTRARQGHSRLVVGRKGAGKTAMFYALRDAVKKGHDTLVLDLKPEGHQFSRLREAFTSELSQGQREHAVAAFWTYILSAELAHKILSNSTEHSLAQRDPKRWEKYEALQSAYFEHGLATAMDLPQRVYRQIDRILDRLSAQGPIAARDDVTELLFSGDVSTLNDAVAAYVQSEKAQVWLLVDNLDKGWSTRGASIEDLRMVGGLLEAARNLERQLQRRRVDLRCLVFLRTDILEQLDKVAPDRGKDTSIRLDWDDHELFRSIVKSRVENSTDLEGDFDAVWSSIADPRVGIEESFAYIINRTLMRPRDVLTFLQGSLAVAINRGHDRILAADIQHAELGFSEESLVALSYEVEDTHPALSHAVYSFQGSLGPFTQSELEARLQDHAVDHDDLDEAIDLLLWFGFLGVQFSDGTENYSHTVRFNVRRMTHAAQHGDAAYVVHPCFRAALSAS